MTCLFISFVCVLYGPRYQAEFQYIESGLSEMFLCFSVHVDPNCHNVVKMCAAKLSTYPFEPELMFP